MRRLAVVFLAISVILAAGYGVITLYDEGLRYGRMWETPAVKAHEEPLFIMEKGTVPVEGGEALFRAAKEEGISSPLKEASPAIFLAGEKGYLNHCVHCHGKHLDGKGTVGQSFSPSAKDLRDSQIQGQTDGGLFNAISYGKMRMPSLASTVAADDRWLIIFYLRSAAVDRKK